MRDLLWRCDEHRGPDADFPAMRADLGHVAVRFWPVSQREAPGASQAAQGRAVANPPSMPAAY
jgi:hypothetical protein